MNTCSPDSRQRMITRSTRRSGIRRKMPLSGRSLSFHTLHQQSRAPSTCLSSLSVKVETKACLFHSLNSSCPICKSHVCFCPHSQEEHARIPVPGGGEQSAHIPVQSYVHGLRRLLWANLLFLIYSQAHLLLWSLFLPATIRSPLVWSQVTSSKWRLNSGSHHSHVGPHLSQRDCRCVPRYKGRCTLLV